jgi:hypothetical protein
MSLLPAQSGGKRHATGIAALAAVAAGKKFENLKYGSVSMRLWIRLDRALALVDFVEESDESIKKFARLRVILEKTSRSTGWMQTAKKAAKIELNKDGLFIESRPLGNSIDIREQGRDIAIQSEVSDPIRPG